jgi:hypothetical protein
MRTMLCLWLILSSTLALSEDQDSRTLHTGPNFQYTLKKTVYGLLCFSSATSVASVGQGLPSSKTPFKVIVALGVAAYSLSTMGMVQYTQAVLPIIEDMTRLEKRIASRRIETEARIAKKEPELLFGHNLHYLAESLEGIESNEQGIQDAAYIIKMLKRESREIEKANKKKSITIKEFNNLSIVILGAQLSKSKQNRYILANLFAMEGIEIKAK